MAQHDYDVGNASGASVRADINNALSAIVSLNSGASAPGTTYADQLWVDSTNGLIKRRNSANSGWVPFGPRSSTMVQAKTSTYTVALSDFGTLIDCTSGTFTLNLTAVSTLGDGFWFLVRNSGSGVITLDGNSSETIDGATTITLAAGEAVWVWCNGSLFKTIGRSVAAATQAEMRTGTLATSYVSPARMRDSPYAAKAWALASGTATGTNAPTAAANIASVIRVGTGTYTFNFGTAMAGTGYIVSPLVDNVVGSALNTVFVNLASRGTASFTITTNSTTDQIDVQELSAVVFGTA